MRPRPASLRRRRARLFTPKYRRAAPGQRRPNARAWWSPQTPQQGVPATLARGAMREDAAAYADRIAAWRTPPTAETADAETSLYGAAGKDYGPRRGPFQHTAELTLVLGLPQVLIDRALPYLTVYSGQAEINLLDAAPEVVAALPGVAPEWLHVLLAQRGGAPQGVLRASLGPPARYVTVQPSKANRVMVEVRFDPKRRLRSEAVVLLLDGDAEPFRVLSWRDDIDG